MNKRNLDKEIIDSIYKYEKKRTFLWILKFIGIFLILGSGLLIAIVLLMQAFSELQTFAVLDIFSEDIDIIRMYFFQILDTIYQETPPDLLIPIIIFALLLIGVLVTIAKHLKTIRNKLHAIKKYYSKKNS